jgi:hypothetical protein
VALALSVDGQKVADRALPRTLPFTFAWDETLDVGLDTGTPVDDKDYQVPFKVTGKIDKLTISVEPPHLTAEDQKRLAEAEARRPTTSGSGR